MQHTEKTDHQTTAPQSREERMASASIGSLAVSMAFPAILAQLINILYSIIDRIYIGHMKGGRFGGTDRCRRHLLHHGVYLRIFRVYQQWSGAAGGNLARQGRPGACGKDFGQQCDLSADLHGDPDGIFLCVSKTAAVPVRSKRCDHRLCDFLYFHLSDRNGFCRTVAWLKCLYHLPEPVQNCHVLGADRRHCEHHSGPYLYFRPAFGCPGRGDRNCHLPGAQCAVGGGLSGGEKDFLENKVKLHEAGEGYSFQYFFSGCFPFYHAGDRELYQYCVKSRSAGLRRGLVCWLADDHAECDADFCSACQWFHAGAFAGDQL